MVRTSSGLHAHSIRLAKQDSLTSLQTKLRQQFRQSAFTLIVFTHFIPSCCLLNASMLSLLVKPSHVNNTDKVLFFALADYFYALPAS